MKYAPLMLLALTACPDDPLRLWIAPDMMETNLKLVTKEPDPF